MFNRRRFIAVVGAVLAAPVAAVQALATKKSVTLPHVDVEVVDLGDGEIPNDALFQYQPEAAERNPCESCNNPAAHGDYYRRITGPRDVAPAFVCLCDPCAEKQGYLCKRRHENGGGNYPCPCGLRGCSGVGPWLNEVDTYKPPRIQDFQKVMDRQAW